MISFGARHQAKAEAKMLATNARLHEVSCFCEIKETLKNKLTYDRIFLSNMYCLLCADPSAESVVAPL